MSLSRRYTESPGDYLNSSDTSYTMYVFEMVVRALEAVFGAGAFDVARSSLTHSNMQTALYVEPQLPCCRIMLFDIEV
jgi:hypothetical protein